MAKTLIALLATLTFAALSLGASAQAGDCPEGQVPDPDTGECVTPRGSH